MTREQTITENVEKLQKYVGLTIEVEETTITGGKVVKPMEVVGYNPREALLIVDGGADGWTMLGRRDVVTTWCGTYWYVSTNRIIKVL
jgi:hypothetical protein